MAIVLIIDSATKYLSLALYKERICLSSYHDLEEMSHAKSITIQIENLLLQNKLSFDDISAVAINRGPGSFTGLRVGSSVAKGLCFALNIPLIAVNGLDAYSQYFYSKFEKQYSDIFILLDARRENYFYSHTKDGKLVKETCFATIEEIENNILLSPNPWVYNSGKLNTEELKSEYLVNEVINKWENSEFEDIVNFEPSYMLNNYQAKGK